MVSPRSVQIGVKDEKGRRSSIKFYLPFSWPDADVDAFVVDFALRLDQISGGKVDSISITRSLNLQAAGPFSALKASPASDSDVEEKLKFSYGETQNGKLVAALNVPAIIEDGTAPIISSRSRIANFLNSDIQSFHNLIKDARTLGYPTSIVDNRSEREALALKSTKASFIVSRGRRQYK